MDRDTEIRGRVRDGLSFCGRVRGEDRCGDRFNERVAHGKRRKERLRWQERKQMW